MLKQIVDNFCDFWEDFVLIFLFEAIDVVANLALAVEDGEVGFVEFVEL
jgi:hypothetical protein